MAGVVGAHVVAAGVRNALEQSHHVVRKISDRAGDQRRKARHAHRAIAFDAMAQEIERVGLLPGDAAFAFKHARAAHVAKHFDGIRANEGVTRDLFAAFDAFEQKGVARLTRKAQVRGNRREQIGRERGVHGNQIAAARETRKFLEVWLDRCVAHRRANFRSSCRSAWLTTRRIADSGARKPVQISHCATPCATNISTPEMVSIPRRRAARSNSVSRGR
jgi:hypothetical protein